MPIITEAFNTQATGALELPKSESQPYYTIVFTNQGLTVHKVL
jgi:hypothetical protein